MIDLTMSHYLTPFLVFWFGLEPEKKIAEHFSNHISWNIMPPGGTIMNYNKVTTYRGREKLLHLV